MILACDSPFKTGYTCLGQNSPRPTREENIFDLLITNKPGMIKFSNSVPGISDQCVIVSQLVFELSYSRTKPRPVRQFKNAN